MAVTLATITGKTVSISNPQVEVMTKDALVQQVAGNTVQVTADFTEGIRGKHSFVITELAAKQIAALMMVQDEGRAHRYVAFRAHRGVQPDDRCVPERARGKTRKPRQNGRPLLRDEGRPGRPRDPRGGLREDAIRFRVERQHLVHRRNLRHGGGAKRSRGASTGKQRRAARQQTRPSRNRGNISTGGPNDDASLPHRARARLRPGTRRRSAGAVRAARRRGNRQG